MRKINPCFLMFALMFGGAAYGSAQTVYQAQQSGAPFYRTVSAFEGPDHGDQMNWDEGQKLAQQFGYQDGINDGRSDFDRRHSYRPTHSGNYKHADRGYEGRFGDRNRYRAEYREAYTRGYHEGFYENGRR